MSWGWGVRRAVTEMLLGTALSSREADIFVSRTKQVCVSANALGKVIEKIGFN